MTLLTAVYVAEGAVGASVVDRYLVGAATVALVFCAVSIGGWAMLEPGTLLRRLWMAAAAVLVGLWRRVLSPRTLSLSGLQTTLAEHEDFHQGLAAALDSPLGEVRTASLPVAVAARQQADPRRALDPQHHRAARHRRPQRGALGLREGLARRSRTASCAGSVAVYPLGSAVFVEAIVDVGDDPRDQNRCSGFRRIYTSKYYAVYANC